jgi:hypothetical protein
MYPELFIMHTSAHSSLLSGTVRWNLRSPHTIDAHFTKNNKRRADVITCFSADIDFRATSIVLSAITLHSGPKV